MIRAQAIKESFLEFEWFNGSTLLDHNLTSTPGEGVTSASGPSNFIHLDSNTAELSYRSKDLLNYNPHLLV